MRIRIIKGEKLYMHNAPEQQSFTPGFLMRGVKRGDITIQGDRILVYAENGVIIYRILRGPGTYCCHCGASVLRTEAEEHVETMHPSLPSPDRNNPMGFRVEHGYQCHREE